MKCMTCFILVLLLVFMTACSNSSVSTSSLEEKNSPTSSSSQSSSESSVSAESSLSAESAVRIDSEHITEPSASEKEPDPDWVVSAEEFDWCEIEFPQYDPASALSYDEYFSEERYLESGPTLLNVPGYFPENPGDMPGYRYVKGAASDETDWNNFSYYWQSQYDNLYLMNTGSDERTLLAEVKDIRQLYVLSDRLYLFTVNSIWVCGRYGEDLTCLYQNDGEIWINNRGAWEDVVFFETFGENAEFYRLHVPSGTVDLLCRKSDLDGYNEEVGWSPATNCAFLYRKGSDDRTYAFSSKTGESVPLDVPAQGGENGDDWYAWVRKYYPLNQY